jgi:tRNA (guanine-N1)-methyltransferase
MKTTIMSNSWSATVLTLFPEMFPGPLGISLLGKALANNLWSLDVRDIRDHGLGKHRTVDDTPAGGGPGMVMRADVAVAAIDAVERNDRPLIYLSPRGLPLTQGRVRELAAGPGAILLCGRFEGLDQRAIDARSIEEISIGDFVLAGGEIAAMALIEAAVRHSGPCMKRPEKARKTLEGPLKSPPAGLYGPAQIAFFPYGDPENESFAAARSRADGRVAGQGAAGFPSR